jgi:hypothetical protein
MRRLLTRIAVAALSLAAATLAATTQTFSEPIVDLIRLVEQHRLVAQQMRETQDQLDKAILDREATFSRRQTAPTKEEAEQLDQDIAMLDAHICGLRGRLAVHKLRMREHREAFLAKHICRPAPVKDSSPK